MGRAAGARDAARRDATVPSVLSLLRRPPRAALWGGDGVELYARVRIHGVLHGFGGLNILTPVAAPASLPSGYGVEDYLVGADATFDSKVRVYVEGRISNAVAENGVAQGDAFAVGMRLDF